MGSIYGRGPVLKPYQPAKRYIPRVHKHEESIQKRLATYLRRYYSHAHFMSDYAAGARLTKSQAGIRKSLQSGKGWPDMFIAWPTTVTTKSGETRHYCGLFLELKKEGTTIYVTRGPRKGLLSENEHIRAQAAVLDGLRKAGYCAMFAVGYDDAIAKIDKYMGKPENEAFTF